MSHDELKSLLALAALERLEADEQANLRAHLAGGCRECEGELHELREAAAAMAMAGDVLAPASAVEAKIEARLAAAAATQARGRAPLRDEDSGRRAAGTRRGYRAAFAAAVVLAVYGVAATVHFLDLESAYREQLGNLELRVSALQAQAQKTSDRADEVSRLLAEHVQLDRVLESPGLEITRLNPLGPAPQARAIVVASTSLHIALIEADGLPATPQDKAYELWWITRERGPVPGGLFRAEPGREVLAPVDLPPAGQHVTVGAVTLEAAGGVKQLLGAMYLKGTPVPR